jgi:hypothetical protein
MTKLVENHEKIYPTLSHLSKFLLVSSIQDKKFHSTIMAHFYNAGVWNMATLVEQNSNVSALFLREFEKKIWQYRASNPWVVYPEKIKDFNGKSLKIAVCNALGHSSITGGKINSKYMYFLKEIQKRQNFKLNFTKFSYHSSMWGKETFAKKYYSKQIDFDLCGIFRLRNSTPYLQTFEKNGFCAIAPRLKASTNLLNLFESKWWSISGKFFGNITNATLKCNFFPKFH